MSKRLVIAFFVPIVALFFVPKTVSQVDGEKPNVVVIFTDDQGYGDLSTYGHPTIATPNLDRMAREGQKWTQFYAAAPVCSPSRASLLTGRLPLRTNVGKNPVVFFEWSEDGLPQDEVTIAERLKTAGYATAHIGKWHLGHTEGYRPTDQGFDEYYGVPYSNDMMIDPNMPLADDVNFREGWTREKFRNLPHEYGRRVKGQNRGDVPLMRNGKVIEAPARQSTLTRRYTKESLMFIREQSEQGNPFFLYYANNFPHVPLHTTDPWEGTSRRGVYGDVIEEIDHSVGQVLETLRETGEADNTLVVFTSDNGPWLPFKTHGGTSGLLKEGKGTTWEGGMRVPAIFWWPGKVDPGVVRELGSTLDLMPTICRLAGIDPPQDRILDGYDMSPVLFDSEKESPRNEMFYYRVHELYAARKGPYKAHFITQGRYGSEPTDPQHHDPPKLYHVEEDPREKFNIAEEHPDVIKEIREMVEEKEASFNK